MPCGSPEPALAMVEVLARWEVWTDATMTHKRAVSTNRKYQFLKQDMQRESTESQRIQQTLSGIGCPERCGECRYNRLVGQNATSLSRRFTRLYGLQPLLLTELSAMDTARTASLTTLNTLAARCASVTQSFVDQVQFGLLCFSLCCSCRACFVLPCLAQAVPAVSVALLVAYASCSA